MTNPTELSVDNVNKNARIRFEAMWEIEPVGPEEAKEAIFALYRAGFLGCASWVVGASVDQSTEELIKQLKKQNEN